MSACCLQHILDQDAVTHGGIIDQHVGHGADEFAVLDDGAAAHVCVKYRTKEFFVFLRLVCAFADKRQVFTPINRCP